MNTNQFLAINNKLKIYNFTSFLVLLVYQQITQQQIVIKPVQTIEQVQQLPHILRQLTSCDDLDQQYYEQYLKVISNKNHQVFAVFEGEKIIGCATLVIEQKLIHDFKCAGHIEDVVIDQPYRGRGYGKLLINHLINEAKKLNCYKVLLDTSLTTQGFYEKCGMCAKQETMMLYFK